MLTELATVKSRLQIPDTDSTHDALLTCAIAAISAGFDNKTNRTLARTENANSPRISKELRIPENSCPVSPVGGTLLVS